MADKKVTTSIKSGALDLIASGSFISPDNNEIRIIIESSEAPMNLVFSFIKDENNKEVRKSTEINVETNTMFIRFYNYNDTRFTNTPWYIGTLYNRQIFILYHIEPLHTTDLRNITYSFYLGEEIQNG